MLTSGKITFSSMFFSVSASANGFSLFSPTGSLSSSSTQIAVENWILGITWKILECWVV